MRKSYSRLMRYCAQRIVNCNCLTTRTDSLSSAFYHNSCWKSSVPALSAAAAEAPSLSSPLLLLPHLSQEEASKAKKRKVTSTREARKGAKLLAEKNFVSREEVPSHASQTDAQHAARRPWNGDTSAQAENESHAAKPNLETEAAMDSNANEPLQKGQSTQNDPLDSSEAAAGKDILPKKESVVRPASGTNEPAKVPDASSRGPDDVNLSEAILRRLCSELTSPTASSDMTDTEPEDDFSDFINEATSGVSLSCQGINKTHEKNIEERSQQRTDQVAQATTGHQGTSNGSTDNIHVSIRDAYKERQSSVFINAFTGKMTPLDSKIASDLRKLGFRPHPGNPLQLEWSPRTFLKGCYETALRLRLNIEEVVFDSKAGGPVSIPDQNTKSSPDGRNSIGEISKNEENRKDDNIRKSRLMDKILTHMLRNFENTTVSWRQDLARLMRRPDVLTAVGEDLNRRYFQLLGSFMPPKLDASPDPAVNEMKLTPDQMNILQLALRGYHLYVGGSAGTGKTVLLKAIFNRLTEVGLRVAMTASTGVAAVQLGGCTFHHAFNAPINSCSLIERNLWDTNAMRAVDVVIIDEVSLLEAEMFDAFDMESRIARMNSVPFGGMQMIVCGDFLQLSNDSTGEALPIYHSEAFRHLIQLKLVTPMRHRASDPLLELLTQLRRGRFPKERIRALDRPIPSEADDVTFIFPRRQHAQQLNDLKLGELRTEEMSFPPQRGPLHLIGRFTPAAWIGLPGRGPHPLSDFPSRTEVVQIVQEELHAAFPRAAPLAESQGVVMPARSPEPSLLLRWRCTGGGGLLADVDPADARRLWRGRDGPAAEGVMRERWAKLAQRVAGRLHGRLLKIFDVEPIPLVPLSVTMALADITVRGVAEVLLPLRLKLGCRVMVNRNLSRTVSNGSVGVVEAFMPPDMKLFPHRTDISACNYYRRVLNANLFERFPVVRFLSGEVVQIPPISTVLGGGPTSYYYGHDVYTFPLQLGYGFTVHKVQGLTLQGTVVLDCKSFFDCPHLIYVACSRVRDINQLIVRNINSKMVIVKRSALNFSDNLRSADDPKSLLVPPNTPRAAWTYRINPRVFF